MSDDVSFKGSAVFGERLVEFLLVWGTMEHAIGGCIATIYRYHDGRSVSAHNYTAIEKQISFLKACVQLPGVRPFEPEIAEIARIVMLEKVARNHIVHGMPIRVEKNGTAHIVLRRPNFENPEHLLRVMDEKEWDRLTDACMRVQVIASLLTFALHPDDVRRNEIDNVSREWLIKGADRIPASKKVRNLYKELLASGPND